MGVFTHDEMNICRLSHIATLLIAVLALLLENISPFVVVYEFQPFHCFFTVVFEMKIKMLK